MSDTPKILRYLMPEDIKQYRGRWVAIRHGKVVADANSLRALSKDDRVRPDDFIHREPESGILFY
jgi:hypothetical protein